MERKNSIFIIILGITVAFVLTASSTSVSFGSFPGSPNFQLESGIAPENIVCRDNLVLMFRTNNDPVCMKSESAEKLVDYGWKLIETTTNDLTTNTDSELAFDNSVSLERGPGPRNLSIHGQPVDLALAQNLSISFAENPLSTYSLSDIKKSYQIPNQVPTNLELKLVLQNYPGQNVDQSTAMMFVPSDVEIDENQGIGYPFAHGGIKLFIDHYHNTDPDYDFDTNFQNLLQIQGSYGLEVSGLPILVIEEPDSSKPLISVKIFDESIHTQIILYSYDHSADELIEMGLSTYWE